MPLVILYENINFGGRTAEVNVPTNYLPQFGYSSLRVLVEEWMMFRDDDFQGDDQTCHLWVYGPRDIPNLGAVTRYNGIGGVGDGDWNDTIRSVNFGFPPDVNLDSNTRTPTILADQATIWGDGYFQGDKEGLWPGARNIGMNDAASSVHVPPGFLLTLYWDANQGGRAYDFPAGNYPSVPPEFNDQASSYWLRRQ